MKVVDDSAGERAARCNSTKKRWFEMQSGIAWFLRGIWGKVQAHPAAAQG